MSKINKTMVSFLVLFKNNNMFEHINKYIQTDPGKKLNLPPQVEQQLSRLKADNRMNVEGSFPGETDPVCRESIPYCTPGVSW